MIYSLPAAPPAELESNLKCLQDCAQTDPRFRADLSRLEAVKAGCEWVGGALAERRACKCPPAHAR
jgi:ArsR family transcriptional regulator